MHDLRFSDAKSSTRNDENSDETRALFSYDYAIIRVVPRVEMGEGFNVGVILFCSEARFLDAKIAFDSARWERFAPNVNCELIEEHLQTIPLVCAGGKLAGTIGNMTQRERFHWLVAPHSTMIQTSSAHCGLCHEPETALQKLFEKLVSNRTQINTD